MIKIGIIGKILLKRKLKQKAKFREKLRSEEDKYNKAVAKQESQQKKASIELQKQNKLLASRRRLSDIKARTKETKRQIFRSSRTGKVLGVLGRGALSLERGAVRLAKSKRVRTAVRRAVRRKPSRRRRSSINSYFGTSKRRRKPIRTKRRSNRKKRRSRSNNLGGFSIGALK